MQVIHLDIETVPLDWEDQGPSVLESESVGALTKIEKHWLTGSFSTRRGIILCIGYAIGDEPVQSIWGEEKTILEQLGTIIAASTPQAAVAYNGKSFDFRFISKRANAHECHYLELLFSSTLENKHWALLDPIYKWERPKGTRRTLTAWANHLGIATRDTMSGADVLRCMVEGKRHLIDQHVREDVRVQRECWRLTHKDLYPNE